MEQEDVFYYIALVEKSKHLNFVWNCLHLLEKMDSIFICLHTTERLRLPTIPVVYVLCAFMNLVVC